MKAKKNRCEAQTRLPAGRKVFERSRVFGSPSFKLRRNLSARIFYCMANHRLSNKAYRFFLLLLILTGCFIIGRFLNIDAEGYRKTLNQFPIFISGLIFILLYVMVTFFIWFGTIDLFRISASLIFGAYWGTLFVWIAELINAFALFHISRKLGQEYVLSKFKMEEKDLTKTKDNAGFLGVFTLRINPLVPFRLMDLGYGLTRITFRKYLSAISVSSLVRIFWLQLILAGVGAAVFKDFSAVNRYLTENPLVLMFSGLYFLSVVLLSLVVVILKMLKRM